MNSLYVHMQNFDFSITLGIFILYIVIDGLYAYYTIAITKHRAFASATSAAFIHLLLAIGVLNYVQNYLYVAPLVFGSFVGTYIVVSRGAK